MLLEAAGISACVICNFNCTSGRNEKRSAFLKNTACSLVEKQAFVRKTFILITSFLLKTLVNFNQFYLFEQVLLEL
jgi:hypothetical protein